MSQRPQTGCRIGALLLVALALAVLSGWLHPNRPQWHLPETVAPVTVESVRHWAGVLWVDARSPEVFAKGHVPVAILLPPDQWNIYVEAVISSWRPNRPVVVYCDTGACSVSQSVARRLRDELGFENVHVLTGPWQEVAR